jgi:hypothetical protein
MDVSLVIPDDALVYSDDDRIERMMRFTARRMISRSSSSPAANVPFRNG